MPCKILCGIAIRFNFICDGMFDGVSDEPTLRADEDPLGAEPLEEVWGAVPREESA